MTSETPESKTHASHRPEVPDTSEAAAVWDERYSDADRVWSGEPNGALIAEVSDAPPGTVLDVGCGEGADAVWLAQRGWDVTALDVSGVALERGKQAAAEAGVDVRWLHSGMVEAQLPEAGFDLVSAQYPAIPRTPDHDAERALLAAVAPGGTLLFVHHASFGSQPDDQVDGSEGHGHGHGHGHDGEQHGDGRGVDPTDYVGPADMVAQIGDGWQIETHEVRDRNIQGGAGAHHHEDIVVKARRLA